MKETAVVIGYSGYLDYTNEPAKGCEQVAAETARCPLRYPILNSAFGCFETGKKCSPGVRCHSWRAEFDRRGA